jgi:hypothetical protein
MQKNNAVVISGTIRGVFCNKVNIKADTAVHRSLRGLNVLSAVRGEYRACRWTEDFLLVRDKRDVVIHSLTANIGQFGFCNNLVHFFL